MRPQRPQCPRRSSGIEIGVAILEHHSLCPECKEAVEFLLLVPWLQEGAHGTDRNGISHHHHAELLGNLEGLTLTELIVETGINDAIAKKLNEKGKLTKNAIAEGIINNLRKTIIRDQLADPRFYEQMSRLLLDLIQMRRDDTDAYEAFLKQAEGLAQQLVKKTGGDYPAMLHGKPEAIVLFNNLPDLSGALFSCPDDVEDRAKQALTIDLAMRDQAPAGWKGDQAKESIVKNFLHKLLSKDKEATLAVFEIVKNQPGY